MNKREWLVVLAFQTAIYCASTQAHQDHIMKMIDVAAKELAALDKKGRFREKEFREAIRNPF